MSVAIMQPSEELIHQLMVFVGHKAEPRMELVGAIRGEGVWSTGEKGLSATCSALSILENHLHATDHLHMAVGMLKALVATSLKSGRRGTSTTSGSSNREGAAGNSVGGHIQSPSYPANELWEAGVPEGATGSEAAKLQEKETLFAVRLRTAEGWYFWPGAPLCPEGWFPL